MQDQDVDVEVQAQERELFDEIVGHIGEFVEADVSYLTPQSQLASSIEGMSSLKLIELLLYVEDCFGLEFDEAVVDRLEKMQDLVNYIRSLQNTPA